MLNKISASDIMTYEVIRKLRDRYKNVPQVIFIRSLEKAKSLGDLFDILDTFPNNFPIQWDEKCRRWATNSLFPLG